MMEKYNRFIYLFILQLFIAIYYAGKHTLKVFNPYFMITGGFILLIFIILLFIKKTKYHKYFIMFLLLSFLPLASNIYINHRTAKIDSTNDFKMIEWNPSGKYVITKDIDFKGYEHNDEPIVPIIFTGTLDGDNNKIFNLSVPLLSNIGHDKDRGNKGIVKNLYLEGVDIDYQSYDHLVVFYGIGTLAQTNNGHIQNVHASGQIKSIISAGGIVEQNNGTIESSSFTGIISSGKDVGGLVGTNLRGTIKNSFSDGEITGFENVAGIAGVSYGEIENCYSAADISSLDTAGGITALTNSTVKSSFVLGDISGKTVSVTSDETNNSFILGTITSRSYEIESNIFYLESSYDNIPSEQIITSIMMNKNWYINVIGLDESIWDFTPLEVGELPRLKGIENQPRVKWFYNI